MCIEGARQAYKRTQQSSEVRRRGVGDEGKIMKGQDDNGCTKSKQEQTASIVAETMVGEYQSSRTRAKCKRRAEEGKTAREDGTGHSTYLGPRLCHPASRAPRAQRYCTPGVAHSKR